MLLTSTETIRLIRNGEGGGGGGERVRDSSAQTDPQNTEEVFECCFTPTETVGLLGTGSQGLPLRLSRSF